MRATLYSIALLAASPASAASVDLCALSAVAKAAPKPLEAQTCAALDATNRGDRAALSALIADDFAMTTASARFLPNAKAMLLDRWTAAPKPGETGESRLVGVDAIRVEGAMGVIAGRIEDRLTRAGAVAECTTHAFTDVWVRRDGRWTWVLSHESGGAPCDAGAVR